MEQPKVTDNFIAVIEAARKVNAEQGAVYVGTEHLLYGFLCVECTAGKFLREAGVSKAEYEAEFFRSLDRSVVAEDMTPRTKLMVRRAMALAQDQEVKTGTSHLLLALLDSGSCVAVMILQVLGIDLDALQRRTRKYVQQMNLEEDGD